MSIKELFCDIPEELQELLNEEFHDCDIQISSLRKELAETKEALATLQVKYHKKEHENNILVRSLKQHMNIKQKLLRHIRNISLETAHAIHIGEQPLSIEKEKNTVDDWDRPNELCRDISGDSDTLSVSAPIWPIQPEPKYKTFIDFNGNEQVRIDDFDQWTAEHWFRN
jgi:hypothetical protein